MNPRIFSKIKNVAIETHNRCNYAHMHKKCPVSKVTFTRTLSSVKVKEVLFYLRNNNYKNVITLFHYNESLIEPRLFDFIKLTRRVCKFSPIIIGTNGLLLTKELAIEMYNIGLTCILVSTYSETEHKRICGIRKALLGKVPNTKSFSIRRRKVLDDRLLIQDGDDVDKYPRNKCKSPLSEVIIRANGELPLCCTDAQCKHSSGNINAGTTRNVLGKAINVLYNIQKNLISGAPKLVICRSCFYKNRWFSNISRHWIALGKLDKPTVCWPGTK